MAIYRPVWRKDNKGSSVPRRPTTDKDWPGFWLCVTSGRLKANPKLVTSDREYGIHGTLLFEAYKAGRDDERCVKD